MASIRRAGQLLLLCCVLSTGATAHAPRRADDVHGATARPASKRYGAEDLISDGAAPNVLLVIIDNARPSMGAYGVPATHTPAIDALAARRGATTFSRAYCQVAWCSPSRNSFLSGRAPDVTQAWGFSSSFRQAPGAANWTTLPAYFQHVGGYEAQSVGKVMHPGLPPGFDFPKSWSAPPVMAEKPLCPGDTMTCEFNESSSFFDADRATTTRAESILAEWSSRRKSSPRDARPLFLAVGYQSPRLPWSFPTYAAAKLPDAAQIPIAKHTESPSVGEGGSLEWFRPTEVDMYSDVRNITYATPLPASQQHLARRAYYAAITHVDDQIDRLLSAVDDFGLSNNTLVVLVADHGQNVGEDNLWSMMGLLETSLRVPQIVYVPPSLRKSANVPVYAHPVELLDLYPSLSALAGLPATPPSWGLPGRDWTKGLATGMPLVSNQSALSQITRCFNCTAAYPGALSSQCRWDAAADARFAVPCCKAPASSYDVMGFSIRTTEWRYSTWCRWDGVQLQPDWTHCEHEELWDHREDPALPYNVDDFETVNVAANPEYAAIKTDLHAMLRKGFDERRSARENKS